MGLPKHSSDQFTVVALKDFVPVNSFSDLAKKLINWFVLYALLKERRRSLYYHFSTWALISTLLAMSFVNWHLIDPIILLMRGQLWSQLIIDYLRLFQKSASLF